MALVGYTIGDASNGFGVFKFGIGGNNNATKVSTIKPGSVGGEDLEGLGTNNSGDIVAVSESNFGSSGFRVTDVDASPNKSVLKGARFGTEAGADFDGNTLYNLQGNDTAADGKVGSVLYKVNGSNAVKVGSGNPVNKEYADGLAIEKGFAVASDFSTADKDGNELYTVNLKTGKLGSPIDIKFSGGGVSKDLDKDSGLAFSPDGNTLYALIEDGRVFSTKTSDVKNGGSVTFKFVEDVKLPGGADYEGFAIRNEGGGNKSNSLTGSNDVVNANAASFDASAEAGTSSVEDVNVSYGSGSSELPTDDVSVDPIVGGDSSWLDTVNDIV